MIVEFNAQNGLLHNEEIGNIDHYTSNNSLLNPESTSVENVLQTSLQNTHSILKQTAFNPNLEGNLVQAFGTEYDVDIAQTITSEWGLGNFGQLPPVVVIPTIDMNGAMGAYSRITNTIYLSEALMGKSSALISATLIEEYGHYLDAQINSQDAPGDEGEIWQNLVLNKPMSEGQLEALRSENDGGTIVVAGQLVSIEKNVITLVVNTSVDEADGNANGAGLSLRDAIIIANNDPNNDYVIELPGDRTYFLTIGRGDDTSGQGDLDIGNGTNLTIRGGGNNRPIIDASTIVNGDRVFHILSNGILTLDNLVVRGGLGPANNNGGGIYNDRGTLNVFRSVLNNNSSRVSGGAIYNFGDAARLNVVDSVFSNNFADSSGGGIRSIGGIVRISGSLFHNNFADDSGGGLYYGTNGTISIANSTFSGNSANRWGGGIYNGGGGDMVITNTTITNNLADADTNNSGEGGGIYNENNGSISLRNTIIAGNFDTPANAGGGNIHRDLSGNYQGNLNNLIGNMTGASGSIGTGSDIRLNPNETARLGALQNNGGITQTHALLPESRAINAGNNDLIPPDAGDADGDGTTTERTPYDQRGRGYNRISGPRVDIGAFEAPSVKSDFDLDGDADIFVRNPAQNWNGVMILTNGATYVGWQGLPSAPAPWTPIGTADIDGDGLQDVIVTHTTNGWNGALRMDANNNYLGWANLPPTAPGWRSVGLGDFNKDGRADILVQNATQGWNSAMALNGPGLSYQQWLNLPSSPGWTPAGVGDMNKDGFDDILLYNPTSGANSVMLLNNTQLISWVQNLPSAPGWIPVGLVDFNGDNNLDILLHNQQNDWVGAFGMNGITYSSFIGLPSAAGWTPVG